MQCINYSTAFIDNWFIILIFRCRFMCASIYIRYVLVIALVGKSRNPTGEPSASGLLRNLGTLCHQTQTLVLVSGDGEPENPGPLLVSGDGEPENPGPLLVSGDGEPENPGPSLVIRNQRTQARYW